ncbi:5'/3'-nucleotidase SurE [Chloroflexota bacterium]
MRILVTNDDGILAEGLWTLVRELKNIFRVTVVAPDRERSGVGTAVTLRQVLRVQRVSPRVPEIEAYSIDGTPADSVILALGKLVKERVDLVISGINQGLNLGEDVHISGTVGAALQGHLYGLPALAISTAFGDSHSLETAAKVGTLLVKKMAARSLPSNIFLNVNIPGLEQKSKISGVKITRLARESHINTVERGDDGRQEYYWLLRREIDETEKTQDSKTDIGAIKDGYISITPLYTNWFNKPPVHLLNDLCSDLMQELKIMGLG